MTMPVDRMLLTYILCNIYLLEGSNLRFESNAFVQESSVFPSGAKDMCNRQCSLTLVESIPENLTYSASAPHHMSIYSGWEKLIKSAKHTIEIVSFYWTLQRADITPNDASANQGQKIFDELISAGRDRHINITIVANHPDHGHGYTVHQTNDTDILAKQAGANVVFLDMTKYLGNGVVHTKLWLIDRKHFYIGSANMDWRSLTQVKELGALVQDCECMGKDLGRLFDVYFYLTQPDAHIPKPWPPRYTTTYNMSHPRSVKYNDQAATSYFSSSPPPFCAVGRTRDIDAIIHIINSAQKFVYIAVMDYFPTTLYMPHNTYWPVIDDALRHAMFDRGVTVHLLGSWWKHTRKSMVDFLKSLAAINGTRRGEIEAKLFVVPAYTEMQEKIPFTRVNHNKYMVTDQTAYIGTSNWSGDYFIDTAGVGFIINQPMTRDSGRNHPRDNKEQETRDNINDSVSNDKTPNTREQLEAIFVRDWTSQYAKPLSDF